MKNDRTHKAAAKSMRPARAKTNAASRVALPAGTRAPDFMLLSTLDQKASLSAVAGSPVILVFSPADWSPVCGDQLALYNELLPEFDKYRAQMLAISVDGAWCHMAYAQGRKLHF